MLNGSFPNLLNLMISKFSFFFKLENEKQKISLILYWLNGLPLIPLRYRFHTSR